MENDILGYIDSEMNFTEEELDLFYDRVGRHLYSFVNKSLLPIVVTLNLKELDDYVRKDLGIENYEKNDKSMSDVVTENYGEDINNIIERFIEEEGDNN